MPNFKLDDINNSVATILRKKKLSPNLYQFTYEGVVVGRFDNKKGTFISSEGKEYINMANPDFTKGNNNLVFGSYLEKEDLNLIFSYDENISDNFLIKNYMDYVRSIMYFVKTKKEKGKTKVFIQDVNLNKIENVLETNNIINYPNDSDYYVENTIEYEGRIEKFLEKDFTERNFFLDDVGKLIMDVYNCEYNSTELFTLAEHLNLLKDYFESALDTIELQLHAYYSCDKAPLHPNNDDYEFINSKYDPYATFLDVELDQEEIEEYNKKQEIIKKKMDLVKLRDEIKKYLINQDEALRRVLVEIARMDIKENENNKGILLLGDSGTGKTYLMELLAEKLDVPFLIIDSTQLTIPGYVGKDIQEYLWDLYEKCDKDVEKAEHAIIFFDEIDKKGSNRKSDSSGQGVLNVLLKFLDGTTYDACRDTRHSSDIVKIDTSKMKIIAGGAFTDVFNNGKKKNVLGFATGNNEEKEEKEVIPDADTFVQKAFMTHEFMGRFPIRIKLNPHTVESFSRILKESDASTLKEEKNTFDKLGVKLNVTPEFIEKASSEALKLKTGVRGLMGCIEEATWVAFEDVYNNPDKYEEIVLTEETFDDPANYQKVLKKQL